MNASPGTRSAARARVAASSALFGTTAITTQLLAPGLSAVSTAGWRVVLGGLALLGVCAATGQPPWRYRPRWRPAVLGGLAVVAFQVGFFVAVSRVGAAIATVVAIGVGPVAAGVIDRVRHGRRPTHRWWVGIGVAVGGIALMGGIDGGSADRGGWSSAVLSGCCFAVFGAAIRHLMSDRPVLPAVATVFGAGAVPAVVLLVVFGSLSLGGPGQVAAVLWVGLITTALAYALWGRGLAVLSLGETVTITMLEPVAATVLAVVVLHEPAGVCTIVGVLSVLAGIWWATTRVDVAGRRAGIGAAS